MKVTVKRIYYQGALVFVTSILACCSAYVSGYASSIYAQLSAFLLVPVVIGASAYISSEGFNKASLASSAGLIISPLSTPALISGVVLAVACPLVSLIKNGKGFSSTYSATSASMLFTALIIGVTASAVFEAQPSSAQPIKQEFLDLTVSSTEKTASSLGLRSQNTGIITEAAGQISMASVAETQKIVLNGSAGNLTPRERRSIASDFREAQRQVPKRVSNRVAKQESVSVNQKLKEQTQRLLDGREWVLGAIIGFLVAASKSTVGIVAGLADLVIRIIRP